MKLELSMLAGAESKQFLVELTNQIDRLENLVKTLDPVIADIVERAFDKADQADDDFKAEKELKKKVTNVFEEDETDEEDDNSDADIDLDDENETDEEDDDLPSPPKKSRTKKASLDDVNDACKALAQSIGGKEGRTKVLSILKKKFKSESVTELKPEQYEAVIAAMKV